MGCTGAGVGAPPPNTNGLGAANAFEATGADVVRGAVAVGPNVNED